MGPAGWTLIDLLADKWFLIGAGVLAAFALAGAAVFLRRPRGRRQ